MKQDIEYVKLRGKEIQELFQEQARQLIDEGYHRLSGSKRAEFLNALKSLAKKVDRITEITVDWPTDQKDPNIPILIVVSRELISLEWQLRRLPPTPSPAPPEVIVQLLENSKPTIVHAPLYLIFNVNPGNTPLDMRARTIHSYLSQFRKRGVSVEEALAILRHYPENLPRPKQPLLYLAGATKYTNDRILFVRRTDKDAIEITTITSDRVLEKYVPHCSSEGLCP